MGISAKALEPWVPESTNEAHYYNPTQELHVIALARKIALLRRYHSWTQQEFAKLVGISTSYLSKIENGEKLRGASFDILFLIAQRFQLDIHKLLTLSTTDLRRGQEYRACSHQGLAHNRYQQQSHQELRHYLYSGID